MANNEIFDRDTDKMIKKINREELTYCIIPYGDELLGSEGKTINLLALQAELNKIKGNGDKCLEEIMGVIDKFLGIYYHLNASNK